MLFVMRSPFLAQITFLAGTIRDRVGQVWHSFVYRVRQWASFSDSCSIHGGVPLYTGMQFVLAVAYVGLCSLLDLQHS